MSTIVNIKCTVAVEGEAQGHALVLSKALSYMEGVNTETGEFYEAEYSELKGQNLKDKIMVYPYAKGSTGDCLRLFKAYENGVGPAGIINIVADPILVQGALLCGIPFLYAPDQNPLEVISSGDWVEIRGDIAVVRKSK